MQCSTLEDLTVAGGMLSIPILKGSVTPYRGLYIYQDPLTFMEGLSGDSIKSTGLAWRWSEVFQLTVFLPFVSALLRCIPELQKGELLYILQCLDFINTLITPRPIFEVYLASSMLAAA